MTEPEYPYHTGEYWEGDEVVTLPCKACSPGKPCAKFRGTFDPVPGTDADVFIQWKGTDVCLDFQCPCQPEENAYAAHFDGFFAYFLKCPSCGAVYEMGTQVKARRLGDGEEPGGTPRMLEAQDD